MIRSKRKILLLIVLLFFMWGCEDEMTPLASYVPIDAQLWGLEFQGYDGYIVADWEISNTADVSISGWEIHIKIVMINDQSEQGFFFRWAPQGNANQVGKGRVFQIPAEFHFFVAKPLEIHGSNRLDGWMKWGVGLNENLAGYIAASRASRHLR
jgi:hypothetical protein